LWRRSGFIDKGIEVAKTRGWILWPVIHRDDAVLIGFCGFSDEFPPDVEIGWRFLPDYWGKGLATEAAKAVMQYGFDTIEVVLLYKSSHAEEYREDFQATAPALGCLSRAWLTDSLVTLRPDHPWLGSLALRGKADEQ